MVKERYSIFQLIPDRDKLNTGSQGFHFSALLGLYVFPNSMTHAEQKEAQCAWIWTVHFDSLQ